MQHRAQLVCLTESGHRTTLGVAEDVNWASGTSGVNAVLCEEALVGA